jgi:hypothetical protein
MCGEVLDRITRVRQKLAMPVIYFLSPTEDSINRLVEDFRENPEQPNATYYSRVHLFFTSRKSVCLLFITTKCRRLLMPLMWGWCWMQTCAMRV